MTSVPFPVSSAPGERPQESAGRLINCYAVKNEAGARFPVRWVRSAGLRQIAEITGHVHLRGAIMSASSILVLVLDERAYGLTESGGLFTATDLGALAGTDPVTVAKNNASDPDMVCVGSEGCFNLFDDSAPTAFADGDLPQPNSVSELNGYFLWTIGDGRIFASDLNSVSVAGNSYTQEQSLNGLLRGVAYRGEFFAFGRTGTGVYRDIGASPFPLQRETFTIGRGIIGTHAVAGWEPNGPDVLMWVGDNGIPQKMVGYTPEPVFHEDVVRLIAKAIREGEGGSLEARAYSDGRHFFWALTNPGRWSWEHNLSTGNWNERESYNRPDWRSSCMVRAFDHWIAGDRDSGRLFSVEGTYYREGDQPLVMRLRSGVTAAFPNRMHIPGCEIDMTAAVGSAPGENPVQTDPRVKVSWSRDGGYRFGNPVLRKIGKQGEGDRRIRINGGLGLVGPKGLVFELAVSDPVHATFHQIEIPVEVRAS